MPIIAATWRSPAEDGDSTGADELPQGKLHADDEHEEDDADLGKLSDCLGLAHDARRERTNGDTGEHVAEDEWLPKTQRDRSADQRGAEGGDKVNEEPSVLHQAFSVSSLVSAKVWTCCRTSR